MSDNDAELMPPWKWIHRGENEVVLVSDRLILCEQDANGQWWIASEDCD